MNYINVKDVFQGTIFHLMTHAPMIKIALMEIEIWAYVPNANLIII